jgi:hypothetical protein
VQLPEAAWQSALEAMGMPADRTGLLRSLRTPASETAFHFIRVLLDGSLRFKREKVPSLAVFLDANRSDCLTSKVRDRPLPK